jgi:hypothetical protein
MLEGILEQAVDPYRPPHTLADVVVEVETVKRQDGELLHRDKAFASDTKKR